MGCQDFLSSKFLEEADAGGKGTKMLEKGGGEERKKIDMVRPHVPENNTEACITNMQISTEL